MSENKVTFGIPGSVVFDMDMQGGPLPRGVHPPNRLDTTVVIICTEQEARAMAAWLSQRSNESAEYGAVVKLSELTLRQGERR
jgi:hypothetical protein